MALHLIGLSVTLWSSPSQATPLWLNMSLEGSAEAEDQDSLIPNLSTTATVGPASESSTTLDGSTHVELSLLDQMVQFLQDNMLLIMVASILFITIFLILCCACIMSRKRKVNAYYPSSFPSKMYVDQRDKRGDAKLFNEVPERLCNKEQAEPMDSSKQLQEDIMRATKNLRTPSKPSLVRQQEKDITPIAVAKTPEVTVPAEGEYTENVNEPSNPPPEPSEDEGCQVSDSEAQPMSCPGQPETLPEETGLKMDDESLTGAQTTFVPEQLQAKQEDDREDTTVTQSIQLITGEKTAF
ncbi:transmembrane protein 119b [Esox lucius]|uniref:transmembrane protein 119b n=1 Tax=Esox lucius TaxID=8010 RepID=UPI000577D043|nr:transmembrane protein 119b [Esox lucius]